MSDPPPVLPRRILVTGFGGAPGLDLARGLLNRGRQVIAADADPLAAGLNLPAIIPAVLPLADSPGYAAALLQACRRHQVDALLPGIEQELPHLLTVRDELHGIGVRTWLPGPDAVAVCGDKHAFATRLASSGIPTPATWLPRQVPADCGRVVVKPRRGHGGQDVYLCSTARQARVLCELVPDPIVQQAVHGAEFTADCLIDDTGRVSVIVRRRLRVKGGLAVVAETVHDPAATEAVRRTLTSVGAVGLCCAQGFSTPDEVLMTEVNLRIAGAHSVSETAGADLIGQTLNGLAGLPIDHSRLTYRPDVRSIKYVETLTTATSGTALGERRDLPSLDQERARR